MMTRRQIEARIRELRLRLRRVPRCCLKQHEIHKETYGCVAEAFNVCLWQIQIEALEWVLNGD